MNDASLLRLAQAAGLSHEWISAFGKPMQVGPDALRTILDALGFPGASEEQCRDSEARLLALQNGNELPPLITGIVGQPLRIEAFQHLKGKAFRIAFEDGGHLDGRFPEYQTDGIALPAIDRYGYHRLQVDNRETVLAVAPPSCFGIADALAGQAAAPDVMPDPRLWGLGVQLYSLRRSGDGGIGDFAGLATLVRSAAAHGAGAVAISPVHAMFSADVHRFSPYGPSSRLFLNALHIDPAAVLGPQAVAEALVLLGDDGGGRMAGMELEPLIDWPHAASSKLALLRVLYERFCSDGGPDARRDFDAFRAQGGGALRDHACFEALHAWRLANSENGDWRSWPAELRDPRSPAVEEFARQNAVAVGFHEFLQWQAARGLGGAQQAAREAGMPVGLIADLAVGADNGGSQAWSRQAEIINGLSVGAPPDMLNPLGQSWGLGAFSPHAMKAGGFGAYIEMLRATFAYAGGARIDHVLGLSRLWLVPDGASPEQGAYLQYPLQDLLRLIALESWRHRAIVIGEDLGTVPPGFDTLLAQAGLLGIRVLIFQRDGHRFLGPAEWPRHAIATTTTHDLPTVAGWWQERDIDWRRKLGLLPTGQTESDARRERAGERAMLWRAMRDAGCAQGDALGHGEGTAPLDEAAAFVSATSAPLAILPIEDALGLPEQPNLPGTIDTHPNWRRRLRPPVDTLLDDPAVAARLAIMNRTRSSKGES
uniref:4-alpha-glucanotransferase n=1 Tax=uncultured Sphingomonas sp. TaxID=158754 RepID=UPI0026001282|nr:4-alpha-glucanotransferase [uncultured Sphingomonas sp.]